MLGGLRVWTLLSVGFLAHELVAQSGEPQRFDRKNVFTVAASYSNDSSHIFLGMAENRKLGLISVGFQRRLIGNDWIEWSWEADAIPAAVVGDPMSAGVQTLTLNGKLVPIVNGANPYYFYGPAAANCTSGTYVQQTTFQQNVYVSTTVQNCWRRWTYGAGLSPVGQRVSFLKRSRVQPFVIANAGFFASVRDVPTDDSSRFNFTFEGGAGVEWYRDHHRAWSVDFVVHHLSNAYTGYINPGIDSGIVRVTYSFGR